MTARPLVVVTRAADQAGGLRDLLVEAGYDVVEVPVVAVAEPDDGGGALRAALEHVSSYDWVVVTSPNGAARVAAALATAAPRPRVAVVGPGTAAAVGGPVDLVASTSVGEGLVADFPPGTGRVLLAQAAAARAVVADGLRAKGWQVDAVVAYRTVGVTPAPELLAAARRADAVVFTSGSTVRHYLAAAGAEGLPRTVVSIGPATTEVARSLGVHVTVTAATHTLPGVVAALRDVVELPSGRRNPAQ